MADIAYASSDYTSILLIKLYTTYNSCEIFMLMTTTACPYF